MRVTIKIELYKSKREKFEPGGIINWPCWRYLRRPQEPRLVFELFHTFTDNFDLKSYSNCTCNLFSPTFEGFVFLYFILLYREHLWQQRFAKETLTFGQADRQTYIHVQPDIKWLWGTKVFRSNSREFPIITVNAGPINTTKRR